MMNFTSEIKNYGLTNLLPSFSGTRVMMMPFHTHDPENSIPEILNSWRPIIAHISRLAKCVGVGYLTIDEAIVQPGETHRRPGLHVDGGFEYENGYRASWGGGPNPYAGNGGMFVISSHVGCRGWNKEFSGAPGKHGNCEHLRDQCRDEEAINFIPHQLYWCGQQAVHEVIPAQKTMMRQFLRFSTPSDGPWHEGYTPNPIGIMPSGPILPPRSEFMNFRPTIPSSGN